PVPLGTDTCTSSTVRVTSSLDMSLTGHSRMRMAIAWCHDPLKRRLAFERTAALLDVCDELVAPVLEIAGDGIDGEVAERAERLAEDAVAHRVEQIEVSELCMARLDLLEQLNHPARSFATRRALAARL